MRNDVAEAGIVSKEMGGIFQRIRKIIDEDQEQEFLCFSEDSLV